MEKEQSYKILRRGLLINGFISICIMLAALVIIFLVTLEDSMTGMKHLSHIMMSNERYLYIGIVIGSLIILIIMHFNSKRMIEVIKDKNEQMETYAKSAQTANEAKTIFLANMSHEIRTPLNAIIGFSDILNVSELPATEKEYAGIVARSAKSLLAIINDILDISKIESDVFDINKESFEAEPFLEQIIELYSVKSDEKKVLLSYYCDPSIPTYIIGDSFKLQQVISNLLSNAIKFTLQKGEVQFKALLLNKQDDIATIRFAVKDSGIGISDKGQKKIFEPFTQADDSITRKFGGTGLGLSISRKIVSAMDSELKLSSKIHEGSLFSFDVKFDIDKTKCKVKYSTGNLVFGLYPSKINDTEMRDRLVSVLSRFGRVILDAGERLDNEVDILFGLEVENIFLETRRMKAMYRDIPILYANKELNLAVGDTSIFYEIVREPYYHSKFQKIISQVQNIGEKDIKQSYEDITFEGTVLVAEDNSTNQILMRVLLERLGVNMIFADNGLEAVQKYKETDVDLILMDVHMPVLDGISAMKDIRQYSADVHIPIIALTADALHGDRDKYINMGMDDYLSKPVSYNHLIALFYKFLTVSQVSKKGNVIGEIKEYEINDKGVMTESIDEKDVDVIEVETEVDKVDSKLVRKIYNTKDKEMSFKERVAYTRDVKAQLFDSQDVNIDEDEEKANKKKLTTLDNYLHKIEPSDSGVLKSRGTVNTNPLNQQDHRGLLTIVDYNYDRAKACKHIGVDEVTLDMLLDNFALSYQKDLEKISDALQLEDFTIIKEASHFMKGSVANLRMESLVELLKEVENNSKNGIISMVDFNSINKYIEIILTKE